jgi:hypothetical protein
MQRAVYVVAAKRTPIGTFGGKLKDYTATDLGVESATAGNHTFTIGPLNPLRMDRNVRTKQSPGDTVYPLDNVLSFEFTFLIHPCRPHRAGVLPCPALPCPDLA